MNINDQLLNYEKDYHLECNKIKFFFLALNEIKYQIEFLEKICTKELEIYQKQSSPILNLLKNFQTDTLSKNQYEPSNIVKIISDLITVLIINYQYLKLGLNDCHKIFTNNIPIISQNLEKFRDELIKKTLNILKANENKIKIKDNLNKYINESFELVVINVFKGLIYIHQFFFLYSKAKNEFNTNIKKDMDKKSYNKIINLEINDFSERKYAKEEGIYYEPLHFGNYNNEILLKNESENVVTLCDSYLYYVKTFIKCIEMRNLVISNFKKLINDLVILRPNNFMEKVIHIKDKIIKTKNNFKIMGIGTERSWDLLIQSWNFLYNCMNNFTYFCKDLLNEDLNLNDHLNDKNEKYKIFENEWEKHSKKIIDLKNKYINYYTNERRKHIKDNPKENKILLEKGQQIKIYLNNQCYEFLNSKVPVIREIEKRKAKEVQEICYKFKKLLKNQNEENYEISKMQAENSASIDIFQEVKDIFYKENNIFQIKDFNNYMENLRDRILKNIDFSEDNLAESVKNSLDNYQQNNFEILNEPSFSESGINSLKEGKLEEGESNSNGHKFENGNNNNINNNDLISIHSILLNQNNSILKSKISSKEIILNETFKNNINLSSINKDALDQQEKMNYKNMNKNNNTILSSINESNSFISVNGDEDEDNKNKIDDVKKLLDKNKKIYTDIINSYYNEPSIKKLLINRNKYVNEMLIEIHFFDRLNKATKYRMEKFEKEFKNETNFQRLEAFENILIDIKDIQSTSPLTLIFHYIFNPKTVIHEYSYDKNFFESVFIKRGDYNINLIYDKNEIDKIPKYFNDFEYVNNLFNNYNKNDLDLFLKQIDTWHKTFSFQINFVHPIKKLMIGSIKMTVKDVVILYFISPTDLIVDYQSYGAKFPITETIVSHSQYRFHCDFKFNKATGRFNFKTSVIIYNKVATFSEDSKKIENDKNNKVDFQINNWDPFNLVIEIESKNNEIEADKIFAKHLKNTIFNSDDGDQKIFGTQETNSSINENSSDEEKEDINKKKGKNKITSNDTLYNGILLVLVLFIIKILYKINNGFLSFDNFINLFILISIGFTLYKLAQ